jgi:hypothetical protein
MFIQSNNCMCKCGINLFWSYQAESTRRPKKRPYPMIVERQTDTFPSNVVVIGHSYSSSLSNHSIQLLEGRSRRRRAHTSRDQCPCPCKAIAHTRIVALVLFPRWCKRLVCVELYQRLIELEITFILPLAPRWVWHSYLSKGLHTILCTCETSLILAQPFSSDTWRTKSPRRTCTRRDQYPRRCQSYEPVVGPLIRADPTEGNGGGAGYAHWNKPHVTPSLF